MQDRNVELCTSHLAAAALWAVTIGLCLTMFAISSDDLANRIGYLMILTMGTAATITVRGYFVRQAGLLRNAFQLGRDSADMDWLARSSD